MTMSPLPTLESPQFRESGVCELPNAASMYEKILRAEAQAVQDGANENVMLARVVGHLLLELHARRGILGNQPCETIIDEVIPSSTGHGDGDNVVFEVGRQYRDHLILRKSTEQCRYSPPSSHPSRSSYDKLEDMIKDTLESSSQDYRTAKKKALARDGFRCMITGLFDMTSLKHNAELQRRGETLGGMPIVVQASHILSESMTQGIGLNEKGSIANKTDYAAGVLAILSQFGLGYLSGALAAVNGVHEVWNLLSLQCDLHSDFDSLNLWFESTGEPNRYKICVFDVEIEQFIRLNSKRPETSGPGASMVVDFSPNQENAPPPDPQLLALHATLSQAERPGSPTHSKSMAEALKILHAVKVPDYHLGTSALSISIRRGGEIQLGRENGGH
ncbi:hypothetical protein BDM02DRAFT_3262713 [Thelephora ganbajun]|uniref:Uncharacterized protein n=1 Tax=Thelephora ganbajun TaxID=370292 RepID=A0ACB6Z8L9_THEGA|nr:hypothetical protein BDM02DRAFT_3262713 [Thelephora ganbajun]